MKGVLKPQSDTGELPSAMDYSKEVSDILKSAMPCKSRYTKGIYFLRANLLGGAAAEVSRPIQVTARAKELQTIEDTYKHVCKLVDARVFGGKAPPKIDDTSKFRVGDNLAEFLVEECMGLILNKKVAWIPPIVIRSKLKTYDEVCGMRRVGIRVKAQDTQKAPYRINDRCWNPTSPFVTAGFRLALIPILTVSKDVYQNHFAMFVWDLVGNECVYFDSIEDESDERMSTVHSKLVNMGLDTLPAAVHARDRPNTFYEYQHDDWSCGWRILKIIDVIMDMETPAIPTFDDVAAHIRRRAPYLRGPPESDEEYLLYILNDYRISAAACVER